jgi:hypothetical protein
MFVESYGKIEANFSPSGIRSRVEHAEFIGEFYSPDSFLERSENKLSGEASIFG